MDSQKEYLRKIGFLCSSKNHLLFYTISIIQILDTILLYKCCKRLIALIKVENIAFHNWIYMNILVLFLSSLGISYILFHLLFRQLLLFKASSVRKETNKFVDSVLSKAQSFYDKAVSEAKDESEATYQNKVSTFYDDCNQSEKDFKELEQLLIGREKSSRKVNESIRKKEALLAEMETNCKELESILKEKTAQYEQMHKEIVERLETISVVSFADARKEVVEQITEQENSRANKWLKTFTEDIKDNAAKYANKVLATVMGRYQPKEVPGQVKTLVEFPSIEERDRFFDNEGQLVAFIEENGSVKIERVDDDSNFIRIFEGFGIDKESVRLTIEEMVAKKQFNSSFFLKAFKKNRGHLEKDMLVIVDKHLKKMGLEEVHGEIKKLLSALNYRTSFTQNQLYHSVEVAELLGLLAAEMNLDVKKAKRMGLFHDLGKALDYRIEGSHAIISADFALEHGEEELVATTIRSHHNDIVLETPFADLLKSADALSSARPGARVDLEEGFTRRIDSIKSILNEYPDLISSSIMHAGREIRVYVDNKKIDDTKLSELSDKIAKQIEDEVRFPGQVRLTVVRQMEISATI